MVSSQSNEQNIGSAYTIRTMTCDQLAIAIKWAAAEGWNPGLHDAKCFYAADPDGFLMGFLDGEAIASISAVRYGKTFGFLGFYIVRPEWRGHGYGIQIWQAGLNYLQGRNIGLDGVVEQQANYVKSDFQLAHRNIRYEGTGGLGENPPQIEKMLGDDISLVSLSSVSRETIISYDKRIFLDNRSAFLHCWLSSPRHVAIGLMNNNNLVGYGVLRPCQLGYKIGPLFADTPEFAEAIFLALKSHVQPSVPFYLDVPSVNTAAVDLAKKYRMTSVFETARMYTQQPPALPLNKIFGITTFELG
ncbi:GNAT family N-acetyltransferase [cf. Phormidesmis sp. LEGE 11477]|uniref:GNAT family N-acetyltransferase n=1 Tax=cf. Phormidesmis sp. LEGE 11477 TaxID=1828680 RepID=UPI001880E600|nr:GNAT family N-acetyltransferase [cf. Phormidesmis sp. LEGE 11477]MBE9061615.1 GNAT family N-acetyltransferase [cf. Phormidesmis sp. LEGE 11477]